MNSVYLVSAAVVSVILLTLAVTLVTARALRIIIQKTEEERAKKLGIPYIPPQSAWSRLWQQANAMRPLEEEKSIELDHSYDGIRELDNHLPPWWTGLFYACIVFSIIYMVVYHFSDTLPLQLEEYEGEVAQAEAVRRASQPAEVIDLTSLTFTGDEALVTRGKQLFISNNCQSCHRADGGGNAIGPNLTDAFWLHGGDIKNIFATINEGVVEKAMPAWGKVMSQKDVRDLTFFVMSLQGSNPANAKKAQGELYQPKPVEPADTTKIAAKK